MLHKNVIENKGGFRTIEDHELDAISGGLNLFVGAQRLGDINAFLTAHGDGAGGLAGGNPFASAGQIRALTPEELEALEELFEQFEEEAEEDSADPDPDPDPAPVDPNAPVDGSPSSAPNPTPPGVSREGSPISVDVVTVGGVTFFVDIFGNPINPRGVGGGISIEIP